MSVQKTGAPAQSLQKKQTNPAAARKRKKQIHVWCRRIIRILFFFAFPACFTSAFSGVKYLFTQLGAGESVAMTSFLSALIALCAYTVVFGRFFCGYACAFGSFGDLLHGIYIAVCKKRHRKAIVFPSGLSRALSYLKYVVLAAIALLCFLGLYGKVRFSPWEVFSTAIALHPKLEGYFIGWILLILIMIGMTVKERFFCRFLCPMGAVFSFLPVLPLFALHRERASCGKGCRACGTVCPCEIGLPEHGSLEVSGDCFQCGKCADLCPRENIGTDFFGLKGTEVGFTVIRAAILAGICIRLGI